MKDFVLYHNPRCSKSRQALEILTERKVEPRIVRYLETAPSVDELKDLVRKLGVAPREIVRTKESVFQELAVDLDDEAAVLEAIANHPILLERPILVAGDRAVVGRPPERVLEIL